MAYVQKRAAPDAKVWTHFNSISGYSEEENKLYIIFLNYLGIFIKGI